MPKFILSSPPDSELEATPEEWIKTDSQQSKSFNLPPPVPNNSAATLQGDTSTLKADSSSQPPSSTQIESNSDDPAVSSSPILGKLKVSVDQVSSEDDREMATKNFPISTISSQLSSPERSSSFSQPPPSQQRQISNHQLHHQQPENAASSSQSEDIPIANQTIPSISSSVESTSSHGVLVTRTQQKLYLQRQHFLADDTTSLNHPMNQRMITKMYEMAQQQWASLSRVENPLLASLERVYARAQAQGLQIPNASRCQSTHGGEGDSSFRDTLKGTPIGGSEDHRLGTRWTSSNKAFGVPSLPPTGSEVGGGVGMSRQRPTAQTSPLRNPVV